MNDFLKNILIIFFLAISIEKCIAQDLIYMKLPNSFQISFNKQDGEDPLFELFSNIRLTGYIRSVKVVDNADLQTIIYEDNQINVANETTKKQIFTNCFVMNSNDDLQIDFELNGTISGESNICTYNSVNEDCNLNFKCTTYYTRNTPINGTANKWAVSPIYLSIKINANDIFTDIPNNKFKFINGIWEQLSGEIEGNPLNLWFTCQNKQGDGNCQCNTHNEDFNYKFELDLGIRNCGIDLNHEISGGPCGAKTVIVQATQNNIGNCKTGNITNWSISTNNGSFVEIPNSTNLTNYTTTLTFIESENPQFHDYTLYTFKCIGLYCDNIIESTEEVKIFKGLNLIVNKKDPCHVNVNCPDYKEQVCRIPRKCTNCTINYNGFIAINYNVSNWNGPEPCAYRVELYKDEVHNSMYENNCEHFVDACEFAVVSNDNLPIKFSGLDIGDYKVIIFPISQSHNLCNHFDASQYDCTYLGDCATDVEYVYLNYVSEQNKLDLGEDKIICSSPNDNRYNVTLTPTSLTEYSSYQWSKICDGNVYTLGNNSSLVINEIIDGGGLYRLEVNKNNQDPTQCYQMDEIYVADFNMPQITNISLDNVVNSGFSENNHFWMPLTSAIAWENYNDVRNFVQANPYLVGRAGIYKPSGSYDYLVNRNNYTGEISSEGTNLLKGTFDNMPMPMYNNYSFRICYPEWVKNNTIDYYNPQSYEIQNTDILGNSSSALYGLNGTQPIAVATNATNSEIAFESFEEYDLAVPINNLNNTPNNFEFVKDFEEGRLPYYEEYPIRIGMGRYAMVKMPMLQSCIGRPFNAEIVAQTIPQTTSDMVYEAINKSYNTFIRPIDFCPDNEKATFDNDDYLLLTLDQDLPAFKPEVYDCNKWSGKLRIIFDKGYQAASKNITYSNNKAHSGLVSLMLTPSSNPLNNKPISFIHSDISLKPNTTYVFSCWVHSDAHDNHPAESFYNLPLVSISFFDNSTTKLRPTDIIINGWQRIEGEFTTGNHTNGFETILDYVYFENTPLTTYFDDFRIYPKNGSMQTYVYEHSTHRLLATLDQNNFATFYLYDDQGNLFSVKRETQEGIKTIQVSNSFVAPNKQ